VKSREHKAADMIKISYLGLAKPFIEAKERFNKLSFFSIDSLTHTATNPIS